MVRRGLWLAVAALIVVLVGLISLTRPFGHTPATTASTAGEGRTSSSANVLSTGSSTSSAPNLAADQGVRLGPGLPPVTTEPCHTPPTATGAAWQLGPVQLGGRSFEVAYYCNLLSGGTGSLDFVLGNSYKLLRTSIGFADGSGSTGHRVRFELIGDGSEYLVPPSILEFGDVRDVEADVTNVTRLRVRITELSLAGGSEGPSRPVLATPTLVPTS